jgi:RNA polymerase sigma factor (sigma-70 family)
VRTVSIRNVAEVVGRELAGRLAGGDTDAVRDLYREYGKLVFTVANRVLGDRGLAEEATQQAFVKLWQAATTVDAERDIRPLLCTITRRVAYDISARERRRPWQELNEATAPAGHEGNGFERAWTTWRVRDALDRLPEEEAEVMRLQHHGGMTHTEIADRLGVPVGTVKSRSHRAHGRLSRLLHDLREEVAGT